MSKLSGSLTLLAYHPDQWTILLAENGLYVSTVFTSHTPQGRALQHETGQNEALILTRGTLRISLPLDAWKTLTTSGHSHATRTETPPEVQTPEPPTPVPEKITPASSIQTRDDVLQLLQQRTQEKLDQQTLYEGKMRAQRALLERSQQ